MHLFVCALDGRTQTVVTSGNESVGCLKRDLVPVQGYGDTYLTCGGRVLKDSHSLSESGVSEGATLCLQGRLRGGAYINLKIRTLFGCTCCCNRLFCEACGMCVTGRIYNLTNINTIGTVSSIFAAIASINPRFGELNATGVLMRTETREILDPTRKMVFYDLHNNEEINLHLNPTYMFKKEFRKTGAEKMAEEDEEDEAFAAELAEKKAAKAAKKLAAGAVDAGAADDAV